MRTQVFSWLLLIPLLQIVYVVQVSSQCLNDQRLLLLQFKSSLVFNSEFSTKLVNWSPSADCCNWDGVDCDSSGHVICLDLENESISGEIENSTGLFALQYLQKLNLAFNVFNGTQIPKGLRDLTNLAYLNLSNAGFSGQVPIEVLTMESLVSLDLSSSFLGAQTLKLENPNLQILARNLMGLRELYLDCVDISAQRSDWCQALSSSLPNLTTLSLRSCGLSGPLDSSLSQLHSLSVLRLDGNNLSTTAPEFLAKFSNLTTLTLSSCFLQGPFPESIFQVSTLQTLDLSNNSFLSGTIPQFSMNSSLRTMVLRYTNFSASLPDSISNLRMLSKIDLSNCNFTGMIPFVMTNLTELVFLDFSVNSFTGLIPPFNMSKKLSYIDLSHNSLTGRLSPMHFEGLSSLEYINLANNSLIGAIPASLCSASYLQFLDLSDNKLSGSMPTCLVGNITSLGVLNLRRNNLSGDIPNTFSVNCSLKTLDLSNNNLGGKVPPSLANCKSLEVMNVGNNKIDDTFPCMLKISSSLSVLVLRNNKFHGDIRCPGVNESWPHLQVIDIASNNFSGELDQGSIASWRGMVLDNHTQSRDNHIRFEFLNVNNFYYQEAVTVTIKGLEMELIKILTVFTAIDFSCNNFSGKMPETVGNLTSLYLLNLSHNAFTGIIPNSIGNLKQLGSLDLSVNQLTGAIPQELTSLTFLSFLNLSYNKLVGMIPEGAQFQTFSAESFAGNSGLCGFPLNPGCNTNGPAGKSAPTPSLNKMEFDWEFIVAAGLGYEVGLLLFFASLVFCDQWRQHFNKQLNRFLILILPRH